MIEGYFVLLYQQDVRTEDFEDKRRKEQESGDKKPEIKKPEAKQPEIKTSPEMKQQPERKLPVLFKLSMPKIRSHHN